MSDSYKNPFSGINASTLEDESILEYWCSPFSYQLFSGIKEEDIYQEETNIVFMGGRSTGKTMFLKYWSYPVQLLAAQKEGIKFSENISRNKGIGFYFRIDGPLLRSLQGLNIPEEHWSALFSHFFELIVGRELLEALKILEDEGSIEHGSMNEFISKACELLDFPLKDNLQEISYEFDKRIRYIDDFRGKVPLDGKSFEPDGRIFVPKSISFGLSKLIKKLIPLFENLNIIYLVDEYENFLEYQQIIINSILKFVAPQIRFRIGMRLEGFRSYKVVDKDDFIKEGREYRAVIFEDIINKSEGYHNFLIDIARKRLETVPLLKEKGLTNIKKLLSLRENLEEEADEIVNGNPNKIYEYFLKTWKVSKQDLDLVRNKNKPLLELMNFIWLLRGVSPEETYQSMTDFLEKKNSRGCLKYKNDYTNKYKLSLVFLLCSIYRKRKKYYSFNTFAFLSSGIVGYFIELCRSSFAFASWRDNEELLQLGHISKEAQSSAASEVSMIEKRQINRIEEYGGELSLFVENLGNVFREYHRDIRMRYPETNQIAFNIDSIRDERVQMAMRSAIKWSIILGKPKMQLSAPSESIQEIYALNRIFSPIFQFSYRTRGGKSVSLNEAQLLELVSKKLGKEKLAKYLPPMLLEMDVLQGEIPFDYE